MIREEIRYVIGQALKHLSIPAGEVLLEHPAELSHGDYSTNAALVYAKECKQKPRSLAEQIVRYIELQKLVGVDKIEIAGPGFINFYLSKEFFAEAVKGIDGDFGKNKNLAGKKVMVEYTDPNPFKEFHIGHLMNNAVGESVARVFEFQGAKVLRACWQGDVGLHVAKAVWGMIKIKNQKSKIKIGEGDIKLLGEAYALGSQKYDSDEGAKKEIVELNKKIFERTDKTVNELYDKGREVSLVHFEEIYKQLGTKFDYYFFEGKEGREGQPIVEQGLSNGVFEKSEGAVVFKGEKLGLHTRVFITSQGLPTYETKELGLNKTKFEKEPDLDNSIIVTANEQSDYFKVVFAAMKEVLPKIAAKTKHIAHGLLRFASGKMSSRKGNVITGESLIEQVKMLVHEKIKERDMSEGEKEKVAEVVAIGAIKYSILRQAIGGDIIFDFERSISFEGDSGPYLQYASVRAKSVLAKAVAEKIQANTALPESWATIVLERLLCRFPEVVERAGKEYEPHYITTYLTELAGVFNGWYANEKIVDEKDQASPYKVALTQSFATVMKNGLWLLGIAVPEKM